MTDVRKDDLTLINRIEDVIALYRGNGLAAEKQYIGFETEIYLYKKGADGTPIAATPDDCTRLLQTLKNRGQQPQLEMASAVEYASPAFRVTEVAPLVKEIENAWREYQAAIKDEGLTASNGALLPFVTVSSAKDNLVDRDRARGLVKGMTLFKDPAFLKVTLLCTSTQISLSYKDPDDLHDLLTTGYALQAPLYALFANHPAYIEGKDEKLTTHPRAAFYEAFGDQGGIPQSLLTATDGNDFIQKHARQVFETPLLFYYDHDQNFVWPKTPVTFEGLKKIGLNTRSNYDLAESFIYTDLKVCNIRDETGRPTGKRVEVRGLDAGETGALAGVPFIHALLRDTQALDEVKGLLSQYGLTPDHDGWQQRAVAARHAVAHHEGKFLDVAFGTTAEGTAGRLKDFTQALGNILARYALRNPEVATALSPIIEICQSGVSLAQQKSDATRDYAHANTQFLQTANDNAQKIPRTAQQKIRRNFGQ